MRQSFYPEERMMRALRASLIRPNSIQLGQMKDPGAGRRSHSGFKPGQRTPTIHVRRGFIMRASVQANFGGLYERVGHS